jgi:hypothetical protein
MPWRRSNPRQNTVAVLGRWFTGSRYPDSAIFNLNSKGFQKLNDIALIAICVLLLFVQMTLHRIAKAIENGFWS